MEVDEVATDVKPFTYFFLGMVPSATITFVANEIKTVSFTGTLRVHYRIVGAWDRSYFANLIGAPCAIPETVGTGGEVTLYFNYYAKVAMSHALKIGWLSIRVRD